MTKVTSRQGRTSSGGTGTGPVKIADVANRWGFWHMGQLAADYRKQFGERPSETLRRRSGARG